MGLELAISLCICLEFLIAILVFLVSGCFKRR
jgi:hypothetical protein